MKTRIYVVRATSGEPASRLIRAPNAPAAMTYAMRTAFAVSLASQDDLIDLLPACRVEDATEAPVQAAIDLQPSESISDITARVVAAHKAQHGEKAA
jgi:hypothetical protein